MPVPAPARTESAAVVLTWTPIAKLEGATVTVADFVAVPPGPVQASVYVVVCVGTTFLAPETAPPVPKFVPVQDVASVADHARWTVCPAVTDRGSAVNVTAGTLVTVRVMADEKADAFPAASYARTLYTYEWPAETVVSL
jgi:hypothetical protein